MTESTCTAETPLRAPYEEELLQALRRGRWDDGSLIVDAGDAVLVDRVLPHLVGVVAATPTTERTASTR